jgi:hypothetical protein
MDNVATAEGRFGQRCHHSRGAHCLEKRTPVETIILHFFFLCLPAAKILF